MGNLYLLWSSVSLSSVVSGFCSSPFPETVSLSTPEWTQTLDPSVWTYWILGITCVCHHTWPAAALIRVASVSCVLGVGPGQWSCLIYSCKSKHMYFFCPQRLFFLFCSPRALGLHGCSNSKVSSFLGILRPLVCKRQMKKHLNDASHPFPNWCCLRHVCPSPSLFYVRADTADDGDAFPWGTVLWSRILSAPALTFNGWVKCPLPVVSSVCPNLRCGLWGWLLSSFLGGTCARLWACRWLFHSRSSGGFRKAGTLRMESRKSKMESRQEQYPTWFYASE